MADAPADPTRASADPNSPPRPTRAVVFDGERLAVRDDLLVRAPGPGELGVRVEVSGVCHSDLNVVDGARPAAAPGRAAPRFVVLGHEAAGVVDALGPGVDPGWLGRRVVVSSMVPCHRCRFCDSGRPALCAESFGRADTPFVIDGEPVRSYASVSSFARNIVVRHDQVLALPDEVGFAAGALVGCAVTTGYGSVRNVARLEPGATALVLGIGGIGANVVQTCRLQHAGRIVAVDVHPAKAGVARRFGATDAVVVAPGDDLAERLRDLEPRGFDAVFECSGAPAAIDAALGLVAPGGVCVPIGIPPRGWRASLDVGLLFAGRRIESAYNGAVAPHRDIPEILRLATTGALDLDGLVTHEFALDDVADAVACLRSGEPTRVVLHHR